MSERAVGSIVGSIKTEPEGPMAAHPESIKYCREQSCIVRFPQECLLLRQARACLISPCHYSCPSLWMTNVDILRMEVLLGWNRVLQRPSSQEHVLCSICFSCQSCHSEFRGAWRTSWVILREMLPGI